MSPNVTGDTVTSVSRGLNMLCIIFNIISFFVITLFVWLYVRVGILLTCRKHSHDRIISLRGDVWAPTTSLTLPLFIEVSVSSQESGWSFICVIGVPSFSFYNIFCFLFYVTMKWRIVIKLFSVMSHIKTNLANQSLEHTVVLFKQKGSFPFVVFWKVLNGIA